MPEAADALVARIGKVILGPVEMVIFSAGFLLFMWGLVKFMWNVGEGGSQSDGKQHMLWGILGMFLMISIWSVIALIDNTFSLGATTPGGGDRKSTRLNSSHVVTSRMPSSA